MADWYVSSVVYAALPAFQASHAYNIGDIIRPTSATLGLQFPQRCTTAGTSSTEPGWNILANSTTTTGGATFTCVGGTSTYAWSAPAGSIYCLTYNGGRPMSAGDRIFVSSDHSESLGNPVYSLLSGNSMIAGKCISVNRAGAVPPGAADLQAGATIASTSGSITFESVGDQLYHGITISHGGNGNIYMNSGNIRTPYFKNCAFVFTTSNANLAIGTNNPAKAVFDNTTVQFGAASQRIAGTYAFDFTWLNTPNAIQGSTLPTNLFQNTSISNLFIVTCRGVDLSALTTTLVPQSGGNGGIKALFDSCKTNASVTKYGTPATTTIGSDEVEFVNCYDGTNVFSERYSVAGAMTTDTSTYLTGGATDDSGGFAHKLVSNANCDTFAFTLDSFWLDVENIVTGASKTATVEIVSSASLNNTDIKLQLEYMGTSGSPIASFVESVGVLDTASALTTSTATWNSPPSTPAYQKLQVTFTPQRAGRVRGRVMLGKPSKTVWINPQIAIT